jgi:hypothetical protein
MTFLTQTGTANFRFRKFPEAETNTAINTPFQIEGLQQFFGSRLQWLLGAALTAPLTAPVTYYCRPWTVVNSSLHPIVAVGVLQRKRISLSMARAMALKVLADTEERIWTERAREAQFLISLGSNETE